MSTVDIAQAVLRSVGAIPVAANPHKSIGRWLTVSIAVHRGPPLVSLTSRYGYELDGADSSHHPPPGRLVIGWARVRRLPVDGKGLLR
jgi:hypothetical protein